MKLAVFDIDGTLHKTDVMSVCAYRVVSAEYNIPMPSMETLYKTYGANTEEILTLLGFDPQSEEGREFIKRVDLEERRQIVAVGQCYEGVIDSLRRLYDQGVKLGVCSMCSIKYLTVILEHFGLAEIVSYRRSEEWGDDKRMILREMLSDIGCRKAVMVGDRRYDRLAAEYSGIPFVGCTYGFSPQEMLGSRYLADSGYELYDVIMEALSND